MTSPEASQSSPSGFRILVDLTLRYPRLLGVIILLGFLSSLVSAPTPYLGKIIIDDLIFRGGAAAGHEVSGWLGISHTVWMMTGIVALGVFLKVVGACWAVGNVITFSRSPATRSTTCA